MRQMPTPSHTNSARRSAFASMNQFRTSHPSHDSHQGKKKMGPLQWKFTWSVLIRMAIKRCARNPVCLKSQRPMNSSCNCRHSQISVIRWVFLYLYPRTTERRNAALLSNVLSYNNCGGTSCEYRRIADKHRSSLVPQNLLPFQPRAHTRLLARAASHGGRNNDQEP